MTDTHSAESFNLPATAGIGRVRLLDRVLPFYRDALGFEVNAVQTGVMASTSAYLAAGS